MKKIEKVQVRSFAGVRRVNPKAAGVDIGSQEIVVCVETKEGDQVIRSFGAYTADLQAIAKWLKEQGIENVAMESTGVYWISLFEELEQQGFQCHLISSRSMRRIPGVRVMCWIVNGYRPCTATDYWRVRFVQKKIW